MNLREILRQTLAAMRAHKMRTFLTMFGIVWGIASVILLVGLGRGFSSDQQDRLRSLGTDLVIVWGGAPARRQAGSSPGVRFASTSTTLVRSRPNARS
jgi:putative ABC transport system permease protein